MSGMADGQKGVRDVKSAARTVEVLEVLGGLDGEPVNLRELAERTQVPRSSLYALLQTLVARGWVRTDVTGSLYGIGVRALLVGTSYIDGDLRVAEIGPHLDELVADLGETVHFARLDGADVVYLLTRESKHHLRPFSRVGRRLPASATALGKALLAERADADVAALLPDPLPRFTGSTLDRAGLHADLAATRDRGYAVELEESNVGVHCIGVALRYDNPVQDAISCSVPTARVTPEFERRAVRRMLRARDEIERAALRWPTSQVSWR
ncbi:MULTISPECIES: IclR family transcriptional regulator [unclassified Saccharopolyspora]|uniref:IclR family transcriptional regulator n=1 Tax=unclassified Saccharopolyspora TaxID=2646250 RepID=UPI001CD5897E|nr:MULTISPECIES: IclR family transcriptional regulator [unclassified Saccharopolyspora]MCA1187028.1 IclR family transcriptional regulator [Saccharopolyspora sp. 6T]MCA1191895.1 IclR family transcriptional regulator [Saccharopolyspora sp. 6V]MCA1224817.1 IclR family transcriptional regulator [Saccharopolyspora sp. 6M]MCA1280165.1 IclR family transcriptional regulator [Saccharopolyspora sp. 7B]